MNEVPLGKPLVDQAAPRATTYLLAFLGLPLLAGVTAVVLLVVLAGRPAPDRQASDRQAQADSDGEQPVRAETSPPPPPPAEEKTETPSPQPEPAKTAADERKPEIEPAPEDPPEHDPYEPPHDDPPAPKEPPQPPRQEVHPFDRQPPGDAVTRFPGIRIYMKEKRLEVKGRINLNRCPTLEFMGCTLRGKTHETLLLFECEPKQLHLALLMLGLKPTPQITEQGQLVALTKGEKVTIEVGWETKYDPKDAPGKPAPIDGQTRWRVEDLIWDRVKAKPMPCVGWVFTGSRMVKVPAPPDYEKMEEVYAASYEGNIVATYHHPHVILDTPLIEGGDDTVYIPYTSRVPPRGTPVTIYLRPWRSGDGPALPAKEDAKKAPAGEGAEEAPARKDAQDPGKPAEKTDDTDG